MSRIEEVAIAFIKARRAKLVAKGQRNNLLNRCEGKYEGRLCVTYEKIPNWCEDCTASQPHHREFRKQSTVAASLLRKLERVVNKEVSVENPVL